MSKYEEGTRIFIGGLSSDTSRSELEREFDYFGPLNEVWVARNPPGFGFIVYKDRRDAAKAVDDMDGQRVCGTRIRVEFAHGGQGGRGGGGSQRSNNKCYSCGKPGHISRDCRGGGGGYSRRSRSRYSLQSCSQSSFDMKSIKPLNYEINNFGTVGDIDFWICNPCKVFSMLKLQGKIVN